MSGPNAGVKIKYAKTKRQMQRNWSVNAAHDLIKADPAAQGKTTKPEWMCDGNRGKRQVLVDGYIAFEQLPNDLSGIFKGPFAKLFLS